MGIETHKIDPRIGAIPVGVCEPVEFDYDIVANEYGFYCIPHAFRGREVPKVLKRGEVYEPATLALMARILRRGGDVISGGAFVGDFLPALSEALHPGALLHSFEPNPVARRAAHHTIHLNGLGNVALHNCAVGQSRATLHLKVAQSNGAAMAARSKIVDIATIGETIATDVRRLDALVCPDRPVAVLHLDVEGHEWAAILGASAIIKANTPCIIVEADKRWKRRQIGADLRKCFPAAGYHMAGLIERNAIFLPKQARAA